MSTSNSGNQEQVIRVKCPNLACARILAVPVHARGKIVRCAKCAISIRIPDKKPTLEAADG